jgi:hypothetical protein
MSLGYVPCAGSDQLAAGGSRFSAREAQCPICPKVVDVIRSGMIEQHTRLAVVGGEELLSGPYAEAVEVRSQEHAILGMAVALTEGSV